VVWIARQDQIDGLPAHASVVDTFKRHQALAAVSLLGVDGVKGGARRRARFFSGNRNVPMLVVGFGELEALRRIAKEVAGRFPGVGIESVPVTIEPSSAAGTTAAGSYMRISVLSGGSKPDSGIRRQQEMVRRLRGAGADGATAYFGLYGFEGSETPHGDSFLGIRRRIPVLTEIVDTAENCRRWVTEIEKLNAGSDLLAVSPVEVVSRPDGPA
jgi:PII-like signaling protein